MLTAIGVLIFVVGILAAIGLHTVAAPRCDISRGSQPVANPIPMAARSRPQAMTPTSPSANRARRGLIRRTGFGG